MKKSKIIRGAAALPFLLIGSVAFAQGAQGTQDPSQGQTPPSESERMRQQDTLSGSRAVGPGQTQQGARQGSQQQATPSRQGAQPQGAQQPGMQQPGMQQPGMQQPGAQGQTGAGGPSFQTIDQDGDGEITRNELRQGTEQLVSEWDANQDGDVSKLEVARGMHKGFDQNGDEQIDESEFSAGQQKWIPERVSTSYSDWDANSDGKLDQLEFAEGLVTTQVARRYDANRDDKVSERELQSGLLYSLDRDGNGRISQEEWPFG